MTSKELNTLVSNFFHQKDIGQPIQIIQNMLPKNAVVYLIGGAIRNLAINGLHGRGPLTKDLDLIIDPGDQYIKLSKLFPKRQTLKNDLGGIRWTPQNSPFRFDISLLPDFLIIKKFDLAPTAQNLLESIDFNVNAILYDFNHKLLYQKDFLSAIKLKRLGFNSRRIVDKSLITYRILLISKKINFLLEKEVFQYLKKAVDVDTLIALRRIIKAKLDKPKQIELMKEYNKICGYTDYAAYCHDKQIEISEMHPTACEPSC
jgi:hypothetical protein